jgi:hypothetical protein
MAADCKAMGSNKENERIARMDLSGEPVDLRCRPDSGGIW